MLFITIIIGMFLIYYAYTSTAQMKHEFKMKEIEMKIKSDGKELSPSDDLTQSEDRKSNRSSYEIKRDRSN